VVAVEIDRETGRVDLRLFLTVDDCGTIISPQLVQGQVHGGLAQGIAQALFEEMVYDENGGLLTGSFVDYAIPSAGDLPFYETTHTNTPSPRNHLGIKGIGDAATIGSTPAVVNAAMDALSPLGLTHMENPAAVDLIARAAHEAFGTLPGVVGPKATVAGFAEAWSTVSGHAAALRMQQRIYQLTAVRETCPSDVAALSGAVDWGRDEGLSVPFGGGEHDWAALELAAWLASAVGVSLRLIGTSGRPDAVRRDASRLLADAALAVQRVVGVEVKPQLAERSEEALVEAVGTATVVVVGISPRWRREGVGAARRALLRSGCAPVLLVHNGPRPGGLAPPESRTRFTWSIGTDS